MDAAGLKLVEQIAQTSPELLAYFVGGYAPQLWKFAQGIDDRPIIADHADAKSYGTQETFNEDVTDEAFVLATLQGMADRLMAKVRADDKTDPHPDRETSVQRFQRIDPKPQPGGADRHRDRPLLDDCRSRDESLGSSRQPAAGFAQAEQCLQRGVSAGVGADHGDEHSSAEERDWSRPSMP